MTRRQPPVEHPYEGGVRWCIWKVADIESGINPGMTYLRRWRVLQTPWFAIYLHQIWEDDTQAGRHEPLPHNHPANFYMLTLLGGYEEVLFPYPTTGPWGARRKFYRLAGQFRKMGTTEAHFIARLFRVPTWTIVFVGRRQGTWYFYNEDGTKIDWRDFSRLKGQTA